MKNNKKVIVAMSGGVDSSVAAKLLKDQGYEVMGIFLHFWNEMFTLFDKGGRGDLENKCCSEKALLDARRVCQKIGIPLYTLNFSDVFKNTVVDNFLTEYKTGNTPNPCIVCNKNVKLGLLIKKAKELGYDYVASGHYVIKSKVKSQKSKVFFRLLKGKDFDKDQSYFLYTLSQEQLSHLIFPIGEYTKSEVRAMAKKFNLPTAEKKESQEICFIPGKSHNEFLKRHLKLKPGKIKTLDGKIIGAHQGLPLYTIGQRRGVEIGGTGPYYVARTDYKTNTLYVASQADDQALFAKSLLAKNINWISGQETRLPLKCEAVIRYHHKPVKCNVRKNKSDDFEVIFAKPQRAVTPGQSVVFYQENKVLGGGIIA